ncbi:ergosterol 28, partial [Aureobasidium melanogenum]
MNSLLEYLPPAEGLLPKWIFFISIVSLGNSIQAYLSLGPTQKVYCGSKTVPAGVPASTVPSTSPVTPLSARTFGTWTAITAIVRLYAAYNINSKPMYELAFWTYIVAFTHFMSEWLVFGS